MEQVLEHFMTWQTLAFCVSVYLVTLGTRKVLEMAVPTVKAWPWWDEIILPGLPIALAAGVAVFAKSFEFAGAIGSVWGRLFYGVVCGWMARDVYDFAKGWVRAKTATMTPKPASAELPG